MNFPIKTLTDMQIFSPAAFEQALDQAESPLAVYRDTLKAAHEALRERFLQGTPVDDLVHERARVIDALVTHAWRRFFTTPESGSALVAVGGYGRGELHPASDIDLLILIAPDSHDLYREAIEQFLTFMWDLGLEIGHSVRTVEECIENADQDITVITNLMESRLLAGDAALYEAMRTSTAPDRIWPVDEFFSAKMEEQEKRHAKYFDTAYNLEPNVKEGPGGLRDIQNIAWVAMRHFGATDLQDLVRHQFLTQQEYEDLRDGRSFLWKVRFALHILTRRGENRLLFDHQTALAEMFGYESDGGHRAVERFMKDYYRTITELSRLNEMLLQLFQEAILYRDRPVELKPINRRFRICNDFIEVTHDKVFKYYPFALLEIFLHLEQRPRIKGVRAATIRLIRDHRYLVDENFRNDLRCRSLFMEILRQPQGITPELRRMNRYGILAAYFPAFGRIVGQMQFDLFHVYTVDDHILMVLRNVRRFTVPEFARELPFCSELIATIPKLEILYLAALLHDIAKGRGGDHSLLGEEDAVEFCRHHGLGDFDTRLVAWLVRNHLVMSTTAQRKDISDPEVVSEFAETVMDQLHLDYLYLLTVADIRGTNPAIWNGWKDSLLRNLYNSTRALLKRGLQEPVEKSLYVRENQKEALQLLDDIPADQIQDLWDKLEDAYFLRHSPDEIAWHTRAILNTRDEDLPRIVVREETLRGGTEIFVYAQDQKHLFAITAMALDQMGLNIVDARIITTRSSYTLDTFIVLDSMGNSIHNPERIHEIILNLRQHLLGTRLDAMKITRRAPRQLKHFTIETQVSFSCDRHNRYTIAELITTDRPGLLARVGRAFVECNVRLHNAKIVTFGEKVEDIFFITDQNNRPLEDSGQLERLRATILKYLEET